MNKVPFTKNGLDKIAAERDKLTAERPDVVNNLQKAREMGDLSENGYYKETKARLSWLDRRLRYLNRLIKEAEIVNSDQVELNDGAKTYKYQIVGNYESNPQENTISYQSPLGQAIAGKQAGDTIKVKTPRGIKEYKILKLSK